MEKSAFAPKFRDELVGTEMPFVPLTLRAWPTFPGTKAGAPCNVPLFDPRISAALPPSDHQLIIPAGVGAQVAVGVVVAVGVAVGVGVGVFTGVAVAVAVAVAVEMAVAVGVAVAVAVAVGVEVEVGVGVAPEAGGHLPALPAL